MQSGGQIFTKDPPIAWDGFGLGTLHAGVGHHGKQLFNALGKLACRPLVIPSIPGLDPFFQAAVPAEKKILWPKSRIKPWSLFWSSSWLSNYLRKNDGHLVVHGLSNYNLPSLRSPKLRKVLTVHDIIPILSKQDVSSTLALYMQWQLPRALREADSIICVSQWTEQTLLEFYPEARGRTLVIPNGWNVSLDELCERPAQAGLQLLTVSRFENYKRLAIIPQILAKLPANVNWTLVTDLRGYQALKVFADADSRLRLLSNLSDEELIDLHQNSSVYVHPSLWEGFCLPASLSISFDVPVVFSAGTGIDEVVGSAGRGLSRDASLSEWAESIMDLAQDSSAKGRCQQRRQVMPTWGEVAARTRSIYDMLKG